MPEQITVRVELGPYTLVGREVEFVEIHQAVGDHALCTLVFDRDPRSASSFAKVQLAELADAALRVVWLDAAGDGSGGCLAFEGHVREARVAHQPAGGGRFTVTAVSESQTLAAHADRRYLPQQTVPALVAAMGATVVGSPPAGEPRDYMQRGESDWAFLARLAAGEGLQLRAVWPRSPDDGPPPEPAEVGHGFGDVTHALTWGRDLLAFESVLRPTNPGVTGAFYDPAAKHDHRFRGVRQKAAWLGGAQPVVAAAERVSTQDSGGGDPGHIEVGGPGGVRARTQEEFRTRLERASAARSGTAVEASGASTQPALRAGDRVEVRDGGEAGASGGAGGGATGASSTNGAGSNGASSNGAGGDDDGGLLSPWGADVGAAERGGTYGLVRVTHRWTGSQYENEFAATPWAGYHQTPAAVERQLTATVSDDGDAVGTHALPGGFGGGLMLGVVVDNADPKGRGRIRVRFSWMDEGEQSHWVRLVGLGGGNGRGVGVLPSKGDEVVLAAVAGDPEHPVALGALWNGVDKAGHAPGKQHWVTPAGNTLSFSEGKAGADEEKVELYSKTGACMVQLAAKGPTGVPTVTVHSEGDLALEAPKGELRITAKSMATFVETDAKREVKGAVHDKVTGPFTVASQARLALKGGPEVAVLSDGALRAHAKGTHTLTGRLVALNPNGATAPQVEAQAPEKKASAWGARPVPGPGPGRSTQDPKTPTKRELAKNAQSADLAAAPAVAAPEAAAPAAGNGAKPAGPPGPKPIANPTASKPCGGHGLATAPNAKDFAAGFKTLQQTWGALTPGARADQVEGLINDHLKGSGVPHVDLNVKDLPTGYDGFFVKDDWEIQMNRSVFAQPTLPDAAAGRVADTAYHEARHSEQFYLMARRRAALGQTAQQIAQGLGVPPAVASAAAHTPLPTVPVPKADAAGVGDAIKAPVKWASSLGPCASAVDDSIYGAGAAQRNQVLTSLPTNQAAMTAAQQHHAQLVASGATKAVTDQAYQQYLSARSTYLGTYNSYRALPEEADAWATGSLVRQYWP